MCVCVLLDSVVSNVVILRIFYFVLLYLSLQMEVEEVEKVILLGHVVEGTGI